MVWKVPGESQGRGSLVSCRLWGRTESDTRCSLMAAASLPAGTVLGPWVPWLGCLDEAWLPLSADHPVYPPLPAGGARSPSPTSTPHPQKLHLVTKLLNSRSEPRPAMTGGSHFTGAEGDGPSPPPVSSLRPHRGCEHRCPTGPDASSLVLVCSLL